MRRRNTSAIPSEHDNFASGTSKIAGVMQSLSSYIAGIALVLLALWISLLLQISFGNPFWFFFAIAVILTTWVFGKGPGWLTVALSSALVLYYFVPPYRSFSLSWRDVPFFLAFTLCQIGTNCAASFGRSSGPESRWPNQHPNPCGQ